MSRAASRVRGMWAPILSEMFGIQPWDMGRLTPGELEGLAKYIEQRSKS